MHIAEKIGKNYAWIIVAAFCLSQGAMLGIVSNCFGLFYVPVSAEFGCGISDVSLSMTLSSLFMCLSVSLFSKRAILKWPIKYVLAIANLLVLLRIILPFTHNIQVWWVVGAFVGIGGSFLAGLSTSIVLERWFVKKLPIALSIVASFSGVMGMIMSPIIGKLILALGWRKALFIATMAVFVLNVPTWLVSLNPYEKSLVPYGSNENEYVNIKAQLETAKTDEKLAKISFNSKLLGIIVICILNASITAFISHLATFGTSVETSFDPSLLVTFYMVGNLVFKLLFGPFVEKSGLKVASITMLTIVIIGTVGMMFFKNIIILPATFLYGASALIYTTMIPLVEKKLYNTVEYPSVVQVGLVAYTVIYALMGYVYGLIFDKIGSYYPVVIYVIIATVVLAMIILSLLKDNDETGLKKKPILDNKN